MDRSSATTMPTVVLGGEPLASATIAAIAAGSTPIEIDPRALERVAASYLFAAEVAQTRPIYGRTTGVGANRGVEITDQLAQLAQVLRLLRSHATSAGELRSPERVRAMLVVRLNQLLAGGNGIDPVVVEALGRMLTADALPPVREWSGVGTGDLSALGTTALALLGEVPTTYPVPRRVEFGPGDALTFMSSNAATLGDAALAVAELGRLMRAALVVAALSWTVIDGNAEAFAPAAEEATPFPGAVWVCRAMRTLTSGSGEPRRIQDPFGWRTLPQVHGALADQLAHAERVVATMTSAPSENPALSPELGVAHHGGFFAAYLVQALDGLLLSAVQAAQGVLGRVTLLASPEMTGASPFGADATPGASGTMVVEYVAAAAMGELRGLSYPAGLQSTSLSRGLEEDASFASVAARHALDALAPLRVIIAAELLTAVRLLDDRRPAAFARVIDEVHAAAPGVADRADQDHTAALEALARLVPELAEMVTGDAGSALAEGPAGVQTMSSSGRSSSA